MRSFIILILTVFCFQSWGLDAVQKHSIDAASTNIPSGSYLEVDSSLNAYVNYIEVYNSTTQTCYLAVGAASAEQDLLFYLLPVTYQTVYVKMEQGKRLAARCLTAATTGRLSINFYQ